jgi:hypothetical protein
MLIFCHPFLCLWFSGDLACRQSFGLHFQVRFCVDVCGIERDVTRPFTDRVDLCIGYFRFSGYVFRVRVPLAYNIPAVLQWLHWLKRRQTEDGLSRRGKKVSQPG